MTWLISYLHGWWPSANNDFSSCFRQISAYCPSVAPTERRLIIRTKLNTWIIRMQINLSDTPATNATCPDKSNKHCELIYLRKYTFTLQPLHIFRVGLPVPAPQTPRSDEYAWIECGRSTPCRRGEALSRPRGTRNCRRTLRSDRLGVTTSYSGPTRNSTADRDQATDGGGH